MCQRAGGYNRQSVGGGAVRNILQIKGGTRGHIFADTWKGVSMMSMENLERPQVMHPVLGEVVHCGRHSGSGGPGNSGTSS